MQHTIAAVFDNRNSAQQALEQLVNAGYARADMQLNASDASGNVDAAAGSVETAGSTDNMPGSGIKHFFSKLFGSDDETQTYTDAVQRGHCVLTLDAPSESEVERAADIIEGYGPIDIDEYASGTAGMHPDITAGMRDDRGSLQQSGYSGQQSAQGGTTYSTQGNIAQTGASDLSQSSASDLSQSGAGGLSQSGMGGLAQSGTGNLSHSGTGNLAQGGAGDLAQSGASTRQGTLTQGSMQRADSAADADALSIPVLQEELKVGKRTVRRGGVRIFQRMVETPVQENVNLREEHVSVERRPVDQPVDPADVAAFQENTFEVRESAEEAVVEKSARVVEEVIVSKDVSERQEQISDTLRSSEVEVEQLGGVAGATAIDEDDSVFRTHWSSNLAGEGSYDDYAPAYRYGSSMAGSALYQGRHWDDVEPDLRRNWESSNPTSAWEKFKAAVREGWDRMTA